MYVMQTMDFLKIGVTYTSLRKRAASVQTGCPLPITEIRFFSFCSRAEAFDAEKILHNKLFEYKTHGEWFLSFKNYTKRISRILGKEAKSFKFKPPMNEDEIKMIMERKNKIKIKKIQREEEFNRINYGDMYSGEEINSMSTEEHIKYMKRLNSINKELRGKDKKARKSEMKKGLK